MDRIGKGGSKAWWKGAATGVQEAGPPEQTLPPPRLLAVFIQGAFHQSPSRNPRRPVCHLILLLQILSHPLSQDDSPGGSLHSNPQSVGRPRDLLRP